MYVCRINPMVHVCIFFVPKTHPTQQKQIIAFQNQLVEGAGGSLLDDASEIKAGVASVIRNLDRNSDKALSRSDLNTYWDRLGEINDHTHIIHSSRGCGGGMGGGQERENTRGPPGIDMD